MLIMARTLLAAWCGGLFGYLAYGWGWLPLQSWIRLPPWATCGLASLAGALLLLILTTSARRRAYLNGLPPPRR